MDLELLKYPALGLRYKYTNRTRNVCACSLNINDDDSVKNYRSVVSQSAEASTHVYALLLVQNIGKLCLHD